MKEKHKNKKLIMIIAVLLILVVIAVAIICDQHNKKSIQGKHPVLIDAVEGDKLQKAPAAGAVPSDKPEAADVKENERPVPPEPKEAPEPF